MKTVHIDEVYIPADRQRREFPPEDALELMESIQRIGLLHPVVLRRTPEGMALVAGERRFRAIQDLYMLGGLFKCDNEWVLERHVPFLDVGDLSPIEAMEAELEENIRRTNLTWQERAAATAKLMELRSLQAEDSGTIQPTVADISQEVRGSSEGVHHEATRKEIILARHLNDPDVKSAKTADEAFKKLQRREKAEKHAALAESVGATLTASKHSCVNADSQWWADNAKGEQFDIILTDPPYGMGADEFGDSNGMAEGSHFYEDSAENFLSILQWLPDETFRLAKPNAHLYLFCDIDWFPRLKELFADAGWRVFRTPLIWHKPAAFRAPWPEQGPQRKYETILYAVKGNKPCTRLYGDVLTYAPDTNIGHQAQKPVALYEDLLRRSAIPGDRALDLFCGSGPIFPAAHSCKCLATGVERDKTAYGMSLSRLKQLEGE